MAILHPWPQMDIEKIDLDSLPVIYVVVSTPRDQSFLHRHLAVKGYCPVLLSDMDGAQLWRFHHPDGERPL